MASVLHNLSEFDKSLIPSKEILGEQRFIIIVADWNSDVTYPMAEGAYKTLVDSGVEKCNISIVHVPGTVELVYAAAATMNMIVRSQAENDRSFYKGNAVIAIGCVIKGDTPHFDYVCQNVTAGIAELNARGEIPVIFSVLTTLDKQQALDRAGGKLGNKGVEGAYTALRMANFAHKNFFYSPD